MTCEQICTLAQLPRAEGEEALEGTGRIGRCAAGGRVELGPAPPNLPLHPAAPPPLTLQNLLECRAGRPLPTAARRGLASSSQCQLLRRAQGSAAEALGPSRSARCTRSRPRPLERECERYRLWLDTSYSRTKKAWGDVSQNAGGGHLLRWPRSGISSEGLPLGVAEVH